jgi:D-arabinose 5-phosphate isomerase GutQ
MAQSKVIQTRVDDETKERLEEKAENQGETLAGYLREILEADTDPEAEQTGETLKEGFLSDIYTIGTTATTDKDYRSIIDILQDNWDRLTDPDLRDPVRRQIFEDSATVYLSGEGSSYAVATWLAARLQDQGLDAVSAYPEDVSINALDASDTVMAISCEGQTNSTNTVTERVLKTTDATVIGVTTGFDIDPQYLDQDSYKTIELPRVKENISPYATRSVILQIAVLHTVVLADDPDLETMETRFDHLESFIHDQIEFKDSLDDDDADDADDEWSGLELASDEQIRIDSDSQFARTAAKLDRYGDLASDALTSSLGHYHPLGRVAAQTHSEFLHTHAEHLNLGSIRHSRINTLFRGNAYILAALPDAETEPETYKRCYKYLFGHEKAIETLLTWASPSPELRLIVMSFNRLDEEDQERKVEHAVRRRSEYQDDGVIYLPDHTETVGNGMTNDMILTVANYLLVYAILDLRWDQDAQLREEVMSGPVDRRI